MNRLLLWCQQPPTARKERSDSSNSPQDAASIPHPRDAVAGGDRTVYSPSVYAPQAQAFYYGG